MDLCSKMFFKHGSEKSKADTTFREYPTKFWKKTDISVIAVQPALVFYCLRTQKKETIFRRSFKSIFLI